DDARTGRELRGDLRRPQPHAGVELCIVPVGAADTADWTVRENGPMKAGRLPVAALLLAALVVLALAPSLGNAYTTSLLINLLMYAILATAWGAFSGTTGYVSLATVTFFGV